MFTPNVCCIGVCLNSLLSTTFGIASRLSSITIRIPLRSDSSRMSVISESFFSWTSVAIFSITPPSPPLRTWNGSSVTMIASLPWPIGSMWALA